MWAGTTEDELDETNASLCLVLLYTLEYIALIRNVYGLARAT